MNILESFHTALLLCFLMHRLSGQIHALCWAYLGASSLFLNQALFPCLPFLSIAMESSWPSAAAQMHHCYAFLIRLFGSLACSFLTLIHLFASLLCASLHPIQELYQPIQGISFFFSGMPSLIRDFP